MCRGQAEHVSMMCSKTIPVSSNDTRHSPSSSSQIFLSLLLKVRLAGQRWRLHYAELRACSLPHAAPHCVAALECLPCDGHSGDETGGERYPQLLPDWPTPTKPPHRGHAPLYSVQDVTWRQPHYPRNPGEYEGSRAYRVRKGSVLFNILTIALVTFDVSKIPNRSCLPFAFPFNWWLD